MQDFNKGGQTQSLGPWRIIVEHFNFEWVRVKLTRFKGTKIVNIIVNTKICLNGKEFKDSFRVTVTHMSHPLSFATDWGKPSERPNKFPTLNQKLIPSYVGVISV